MSKGQSTKIWLVESMLGVVTGYVLTVFIQLWVYHSFGLYIQFGVAHVISFFVVVATFSKHLSVRKQLSRNASTRFPVAWPVWVFACKKILRSLRREASHNYNFGERHELSASY